MAIMTSHIEQFIYGDLADGMLYKIKNLKDEFDGFSVFNSLPIPLRFYMVTESGEVAGLVQTESGQTWGKGGTPYTIGPWNLTDGSNQLWILQLSHSVRNLSYWLLTNDLTGGFVKLIQARKDNPEIPVLPDTFLAPNKIGGPPKPRLYSPVPPNSWAVTVGLGVIGGNLLIREQMWELLDNSYTLAPGESREITYVQKSGVRSSSSDEETTSKSIGSSASVGWGPISASISASLSHSSTHSQSLSFKEQQEVYVTRTISNSATSPVAVYIWQLVDIYSIFSSPAPGVGAVQLASITVDQAPAIVDGLYDLQTLRPIKSKSSKR